MAAARGREHVRLDGICTIGVEEIDWHEGCKRLALACQVDKGRCPLRVGKHRKISTPESCFDWFGRERAVRLQVVRSDMRKACLEVAADRAAGAGRALDRFRFMKKLSEAIDEVRRAAARKFKAEGKEPVLKKFRWLLLKWSDSLSEKRILRL